MNLAAGKLVNCRSRLPCFTPLLIYFVLLLSFATDTRADEGPFGLPSPHNKDRPGAVMLHGGGPNPLDDTFRQEFVRLAGGREARILLMPSDMCQLGKDDDGKPLRQPESIEAYERRLASPENYGRWAALGSERQVADFQFLYPDRAGDRSAARFFSLLEKATGVWLPAYDQEWLPSQFAGKYPDQTSRFQLALREVVARGGVVGGLGGGMASLPETVIAGDDRVGDGWSRARLRFGLALFSGAVVDQNFASHAGRLERLTDLLRNGDRLDRLAGRPGVERRTIGLGVEAGTAMILQGDSVRVMGEGRGHIFLKSNGDRTIAWRTLEAGDDPITVRSSVRASRRRPLADGPGNVDAPGNSDAASAANPFGAPEPLDPARVGIVILHGGGDTDEIIDMMPKLAGAAKPRLAHCPAARDSCRPSAGVDPAHFARHLEETFDSWRKLQIDGRLADLTFITTSNPADANNADFVQPLTRADALWFCGGDQAPLARLFVDPLRPTLFQQEALNIVRRGGAVGGTSAGLAVMGDVMIESGDPENGEPASANLSRGLGMLKHVLAEQHFDARGGRIERLTGLLRDHKRLANFAPTCRPRSMIGVAVEEDTALLVQGNHARVVGKKLAHIFLQSSDPRAVTWHALEPGDAAIIRPGREGYVLELDDWEFGD